MPVGGKSNKAQAGVVNKKAKSQANELSAEDIAHKKKMAEDQKKLKEAAAKMGKKK